MNFGNGGYRPIPNNDIWSAPNGTYGVVIPPFGSLGNAHTTPQISGTKVVKGDGYVRYENTETGQFTVVSRNGMITGGSNPF